MNLAEHPTVRRFHESHGDRPGPADPPKSLDAAWLRQLRLDCGADDAGLVEISRPALDDQRDDILRSFPPPSVRRLGFRLYTTLASPATRRSRPPPRSGRHVAGPGR